jgi:uncharacterized membrane protein YbhN (UPF0104 family)
VTKLVRLAVSAALLGWIGWNTDWEQVREAFAHLRVELWLGAVGVLCATQVASAWRWQMIARRMEFDRPLRQFTGFYFIGMYFNLLLPTSVGGDVIRAWYLGEGSGRRLAAFLSVLLDRLAGLLVLLGMACLAVTLSPLDLPAWIPLSIWGAVGGALVGLPLLPHLAGRGKKGALRAEQVRTAFALFRSPRLVAGTALLSVYVQVSNVVLVWLLGLALHAQVPGAFYWVLVPMVSLLTLLPVSVNGMGVREGATALMLVPLGVSHGTALTLAFLWFLVHVAASLSGGVVYLFGRFPKPVTQSEFSAEVPADGCVDCDSDQGRAGQFGKAA